MIINQQIIAALSTLDIPVSFQTYLGTSTTYVTFFEILGQGSQYADNKATNSEHYIQIDLWSKDDYSDYIAEIRSLIDSAGFGFPKENELYENGTKIYHKIFRTMINENLT